MRDCVYPLQKAYLIALSNLSYESIAVPVWYQMAPDNIVPNNYVIFGPVTSNDISTFHTADTSTLMRVTVHTFDQKYNTGKAAASIAGLILAAIYPDSQTNLDLSADNFQIVSTDLVSDTTQNYSNVNSRVYIDRILIFRHKIFHG